MRKYGKGIWQMFLLCAGIVALLALHPVDTQAASMKISRLTVSAPAKGSTYASGTVKYTTSSYKNLKLRVRVLNSKGKYVYQKTLSGLKNSGSKTITWNGKASAGNTAKAAKNKIVADGTYRLEVCLSGKKGKKTSSVTRKSTFKIARTAKQTVTLETVSYTDKAPAGVSRLTGDAELDYMAEMMLKEAGVEESMSAEEKVRTIYYWVSNAFSHVHDSYANYPKHYDLETLTDQIQAYKNTTDILVRNNEAAYVKQTYCSGIKLAPAAYTDTLCKNFQNTAKLWFNARVGQCNRTADAFMILCNHAGVEAGVCAGYYLNSNGTRSGHYWNWVRLGEEIYYYDVDVQLQNNARGFKYPYYERWYKADRTMALKHHLFTHGLQN